jgi:hypothetical protein
MRGNGELSTSDDAALLSKLEAAMEASRDLRARLTILQRRAQLMEREVEILHRRNAQEEPAREPEVLPALAGALAAVEAM